MKQTLKRRIIGRLIVGIGILAALLVVPVAFSSSAQAAPPPNTMNFQGRLADSSGAAVADGLYNIRFRIYNVDSGGTALWTEVRETSNRVQVTNGLFSTQLGEVNPLTSNIFNATNLYFEITMATPATANCDTASCASWESPMTPRNKLATSAYAFNTWRLNGYTSSDFASASGSANYIQNQSASPQAASFYVSGSGQVGGTFTADGATAINNTLQVRSSSATAFRVQDAAGSNSFFTVDAINNKVVIGSPSTSILEAFLVLDNYDSMPDPSGGQEGSMYYNTASNSFRCYEYGVWKNCDSNTKGRATSQTSNYTAKHGDFVIANSTGGSFTITLPAPKNGSTISVKKVNAGNDVSVVVTGGGQIDNLTTVLLQSQWVSQDFYSDGTQWYRV